MSKIPAVIYNGHYLFEEGVLEFDVPVEIHVSRFGNTEHVVNSRVEGYPNYNIEFNNSQAFKVFINTTEPETSPNRENLDVILTNHKQYDLILTSDEVILNNTNNSVKFPYGSTWLNKGDIDHPDGLGSFDEEIVKDLWNDKKFEVSFVLTAHYRSLSGYDLRKDLAIYRDWIEIPTKFYNSTRMGGTISEIEPLLDDDKKNLFHSQFSFSIENSKVKNYFSEKLIDCFITKTVPIYHGCPNIDEYFDTRGMILVGDAVKESIDAVNNLTPETYEKMMPYIEENYKRALEYVSLSKRVKEEIEKAIPNKKQKLLTVGILTLEEDERRESLNKLLSFFDTHMGEDREDVEILINIDDGTKSVGQKRNEVLDNATGKFVCFVDDVDMVSENYFSRILKIIRENDNLDCIGFTGMYYVNGNNVMLFRHANKYGGHYKDPMGVQHRPVNHLNPVKTSYAKLIRFPEQDFGEDSDYCDRLLESGLIENEVIIDDEVMYHYLWSEEGSRTHA